jgi:hypothetical protein
MAVTSDTRAGYEQRLGGTGDQDSRGLFNGILMAWMTNNGWNGNLSAGTTSATELRSG